MRNKNMTEYQEITLTETHEKLIVSTTEYPLTLAGIFYIKFIQYEKNFNVDQNTKTEKLVYDPTKFITLLPQNILKRENIWTQEEEDEIIKAAQAARDREVTMADYRAAAEEEMKSRSKEIQPSQELIDNDDIDPDFKTSSDPLDPNYG